MRVRKKTGKRHVLFGVLFAAGCLFTVIFLRSGGGEAIRTWLFFQSERFTWEFLYPETGLFPEVFQRKSVQKGQRDADPSYARYIERRKAKWEEQIKEAQEEKERKEAQKKEQKEAQTEEEPKRKEPSGNGVLKPDSAWGTAAGAQLFGEELYRRKAENGIIYLEEQLADYDFVMKHFYTVHPTAAAGRDLIQAEVFLEQDFSLEKEKNPEKPQILIYHTHSQETYADYQEGNKNATVGTVGEYLAGLLREKGYQVLHDTTPYDLKGGELDRSKAYQYALDGIDRILQNYPSVQVVLDVHRDGVPEGTHLVSEINGKQTASIMFFNGTSETPEGPISYLPNPCRTENLAFSFQLKLCADALYPEFTRNIYLKGLRYNQHLKPRSALIEAGAQTNTLEEALNAMEPLSELLNVVLGGA